MLFFSRSYHPLAHYIFELCTWFIIQNTSFFSAGGRGQEFSSVLFAVVIRTPKT